jgi:predicted RNA-binding protein with TRAM domain
MEISDNLLCLFTDQVEETKDSYQITVPDQEIDHETIAAGETYRVVLMPQSQTATTDAGDTDTGDSTEQRREPPVETGDTREVEIESLGDQGDGIARIDRGYVVIIPDTNIGDHVTVRINKAQQNVAFAEVIDRNPRLQND